MELYLNKSRFEGNFEFGQKNGNGKLIQADGKILEDFWVNDARLDENINPEQDLILKQPPALK